MRRPSDLGAPAKFTEWRKHQLDAILEAASSKHRFLALCQPTGSGKSLTYWAATKLLELTEGKHHRSAYLTATKGLEDQLGDDFPDLIDIRGQSNYTCLVDGHTVDHGVCHLGIPCSLRSGGCLYFDQVARAQKGRRVNTNYMFWMSSYAYADGLGGFDALVLDEAHAAFDQLTGFLSIFVGAREARLVNMGAPPDAWRSWARELAGRAFTRLAELRRKVPPGLRVGDGSKRVRFGGPIPRGLKTVLREMRHYKNLLDRANRLVNAKGEWVLERVEQGHTWTPVWPGPYAEEALYKGAVRVFPVSATITHKTLDLLGIPRDQRTLIESPSTFPVERRPVCIMKFRLPVRLTYRSTKAELEMWVHRIDKLLEDRGDRKGIIHTWSYDRARFYLAHSKHRRRLLSHESATTSGTVEEFKDSSKPLVLVSPVMTTGWNFPYEECEFNIIGKVPFSDVRTGVNKARHEQDKTYRDYRTMDSFVQMAGRGMRATDDQCETIVADEQALWFVFKNQHMANRWFMQSVSVVQGYPSPLPKLRR